MPIREHQSFGTAAVPKIHNNRECKRTYPFVMGSTIDYGYSLSLLKSDVRNFELISFALLSSSTTFFWYKVIIVQKQRFLPATYLGLLETGLQGATMCRMVILINKVWGESLFNIY